MPSIPMLMLQVCVTLPPIVKRTRVDDTVLVPLSPVVTRPIQLPLSLSYDHRVIDGADAARFTTYLAKALADVQGLLRAIP